MTEEEHTVEREKSPLRKLIDERGIKDFDGLHALVKELTSGLIQEIMDAELEDELGYSKCDYRNKQTDNSRNGHFKKTVSSSQGEIELKVPRDRKGEFEPQIVPKHEKDISKIEDKILFLYFRAPRPGISRKSCRRCMGSKWTPAGSPGSRTSCCC